MTSATTVGVVGGFKVVPQYLLNAAWSAALGPRAPSAPTLTPCYAAGSALVLAASALYCWARGRRIGGGADGRGLGDAAGSASEGRRLLVGVQPPPAGSHVAQGSRPGYDSIAISVPPSAKPPGHSGAEWWSVRF